MSTDHSIVVFVDGPDLDLDFIHRVDLALWEILDDHPAGRHDGHEMEIDGDHAFFFLYGPDADALFAAVAPTLRRELKDRQATLHLRYGGIRETEVEERSLPLTEPH